jgi:hypothetical protein
MLKLEMKGMSRSKSPTAYAMLKQMGYWGTREKVLSDLDAWRDEFLGESR